MNWLIPYTNEVIKYNKSPSVTFYERWEKNKGKVIKYISYDLKTWEAQITPYKEIPIFIINHKEN